MSAPEASTWLEKARAAQAAGDLLAAYNHCLEAVQRDPRHARTLVAIGLALYRSRQSAAAMEAFDRAARADPKLAEAWANLAALLLEAERFPEATAALNRALSLAPALADLHALRGDLLRLTGEIGDAVGAYARAVELGPDAPAFLNKLSSAQRLVGDVSSAEMTLRRLLTIDPSFGLARVNLGTLCVEQNRVDEGRALLREALSARGLDAEALHEAKSTLLVLADHERCAEAIAQAIAREDDSPITIATHLARDDELGVDEDLLERLAEVLARSTGASFADGFRELDRLTHAWPAIEAHFALHRGDQIDALRATAEIIGTGDAERGVAAGSAAPIAVRELRRHARVIARRGAHAAPRDGAAWEARIRYWHASLMWEHPAVFPGQVKPTPNLVRKNPLVKRVRPEHTVGTLRRFYAGVYRQSPPGPLRAIFVHYAIGEIHPFADGNGRLARFLANFELETAGWHPLVFTDHASRSMLAALNGVRLIGELEPLRDLFLVAASETSALIASLDPRS